MIDMKYVFVLWHSYELNDGEEDSKLLGIYSSASIANEKTNEYKLVRDSRSISFTKPNSFSF